MRAVAVPGVRLAVDRVPDSDTLALAVPRIAQPHIADTLSQDTAASRSRSSSPSSRIYLLFFCARSAFSYGPNGFVRSWTGSTKTTPPLSVHMEYDEANDSVTIVATGEGKADIVDNAYVQAKRRGVEL